MAAHGCRHKVELLWQRQRSGARALVAGALLRTRPAPPRRRRQQQQSASVAAARGGCAGRICGAAPPAWTRRKRARFGALRWCSGPARELPTSPLALRPC